MTILFVSGAPDDNTGEFRGIDAAGKISWNVSGCCDVEQYVKLRQGASASILMFGPKIEQSEITFHRRPSLVFNQIADPDTHAGSLSRCATLCRQLSVPVINHPDRVMATTRDGVAEALQGIPGVQMPLTVRVNPSSPDEVFALASVAGIELPFIARLAGFHNGRNMVLLRSREDLDLLHVLPFDGRDFYLTQFVDFRNERGVYTKTRVAMIDGEPCFRSFLYDRSWMIHSGSRQFMDEHPDIYSDEEMTEKQTSVPDAAKPAFQQIKDRLGLDYFGVDCHINRDGRVLIFEANVTMNLLAKSPMERSNTAEKLRDRTKALIARRSGENLG